jgi:hypothetical protein
MAHINFKTSKPTKTPAQKKQIASGCRRCGPECQCSAEEIDAGGPA